MEGPPVFAEGDEGVDSDVTDSDVLAALERATRESGIRARRPGEFDRYQWQAHLASLPDPILMTGEGTDDRLRQLVKDGKLGTAIAYDNARHQRLRVYWWLEDHGL